MMANHFVRLEGVSKAWGTSFGVRDVSLAVERGEFVVLLGPSGCGKSTTLRLVAGLEAPSAGRIVIDGRDVTHVPPAERRLSMVFQSYALFPHLSVEENIVFGLRVRRVPRAERRARLAEAVRLTGLGGLEARKPAELSGGQRQRVALARAVIADHPLCLMDEPLSNLDAKLRHAVRQDIRALQQRLGMTVLYVTHDQTEAMGMADRIVLMRDGAIEQVGRPEDLYERPASLFAAGFIGSPPMNVLPADLVPPALRPPGLPPDARLGVRPEHLAPAEAGAAGIEVRVTSSEYLGAETLVYFELGGQELNARLPGRAAFAPGQAVRLAWGAGDVHAFDGASGVRIDPAAPAAPLRAEPRPAGGYAS